VRKPLPWPTPASPLHSDGGDLSSASIPRRLREQMEAVVAGGHPSHLCPSRWPPSRRPAQSPTGSTPRLWDRGKFGLRKAARRESHWRLIWDWPFTSCRVAAVKRSLDAGSAGSVPARYSIQLSAPSPSGSAWSAAAEAVRAAKEMQLPLVRTNRCRGREGVYAHISAAGFKIILRVHIGCAIDVGK